MTTSRSSRAQRTVVIIGTALLLVLGTGMAIASGATGSLERSTPQVITSDRPVEAAAAPAVAGQAPVENPAVRAKPRPLSAPDYSPSLPVIGRRTSPSKTTASSRKPKSDSRETVTPKVRDGDDDSDDHETVTPPVRDDDDDKPDTDGSGTDD